MNPLYKIYQQLFDAYGPQGWWPFLNSEGEMIYFKGDYTHPHNDKELFEVCLGSILTQNTTFTSVVRSLQNLQALDALSPQSIQSMDLERLKEAIRPSGYHNQKARYILAFIDFFDSLNGRIPSRDELLNVVGIGEETADSILLFGYKQLEFKVDAYTKRVLVHLGIVNEKAKYREIKYLIEDALQELIDDKEQLLKVYMEYHALIVCHAKRYYSKKPYGEGCILRV
jgi:endonuclease-3 related protein